MTHDARTAEHARLAEAPGPDDDWRTWGPYVAGRQWGTVREDYSADGDAWAHLPFDHAHRRAYRWGEDGLAAICDRHGLLNLGLAMWNGRDDRLKERVFGLAGPEGNHGEDAKEYWWHLDATPTHSYAQVLHRYPHAAFPYADLVAENGRRGYGDEEYELTDTGLLADDRFFDVTVTHAKASPYDVVVEVAATNHGPDPAPLHLLPQLWFRNTWSWGRDDRRPSIRRGAGSGDAIELEAQHEALGRYRLLVEGGADGAPEVLLCDNETNMERLHGTSERQPAHPKDAIDDAVVHGDPSHLAPEVGTKAALWWRWDAVAPGETVSVRLRLTREDEPGDQDSAQVLEARRTEADEFYGAVIPASAADDDRHVARRAFAGLMWCKQLYRYDIRQWLEGDPGQVPPPPERLTGRNAEWTDLALADVISMPDEWEYPWFATWDLAFHCVAFAHVDPAFAKEQLELLCRERAMHPHGQLPAYEWNFGDVNPPVHAWAAWQVYRLDGGRDREFLVRVFTRLLLNFGWWVDRKDADGSRLFEGGFLGMDNVGPFDRSAPLAEGRRLEQSDATSWMAFFSLAMLRIAWELAREDRAWEEAASTFLEHFLEIAEAMDSFGSGQVSLWDEEEGFYYDVIVGPDGSGHPVKVRSMVGLLPLMAVAVEPDWVREELPDFTSRMDRLVEQRPELVDGLVHSEHDGQPDTTLSLLTPERLGRLLSWLLDEGEFLAPYGVRALSAAYRDGVDVDLGDHTLPLRYVPGESENGMFGGNSNWRGPIWFPVNVLLTDALRAYSVDMGRDLTVEMPTGSGRQVLLRDVARDLEQRLVGLFRLGEDGRRPSDPRHVPTGPHWQGHPTFSEYFHGDTGAGLGASHQTGWTAMVAHLICAHDDVHAAARGGDSHG